MPVWVYYVAGKGGLHLYCLPNNMIYMHKSSLIIMTLRESKKRVRPEYLWALTTHTIVPVVLKLYLQCQTTSFLCAFVCSMCMCVCMCKYVFEKEGLD